MLFFCKMPTVNLFMPPLRGSKMMACNVSSNNMPLLRSFRKSLLLTIDRQLSILISFHSSGQAFKRQPLIGYIPYMAPHPGDAFSIQRIHDPAGSHIIAFRVMFWITGHNAADVHPA